MARKEKNIHYLYKTTCNITGRYYIGMHSTNNLEDGYMGSGLRLRRSLRKYGVENHTKEILEYFNNRDLLVEAEKTAITENMINDDMCMNLKGGGEGGFSSEEHKEKFLKCSLEWFKNQWQNDDFRNKMKQISSENMKKSHKNNKFKYNNFINKSHTGESKEKISLAMREKGVGESNSQYGTCWITKDGVNKKIKKEDFEIYLDEGWVKGRDLKKSS